jgi:hypothetical protein
VVCNMVLESVIQGLFCLSGDRRANRTHFGAEIGPTCLDSAKVVGKTCRQGNVVCA